MAEKLPEKAADTACTRIDPAKGLLKPRLLPLSEGSSGVYCFGMEPAKVFPIYQLQDAFEAFCNGEPAVKPQHRSLYYFLLGYCRRRGNTPKFSLTHEAGMHGSAIGSWATYDACLKSLAEWGFIHYTPGANRYKVPVVELTFRNPTDDVLLAYWQSYCLSTSNPSGDQLVTLKEDLKKEERKDGSAQSQAASQPDSFSSSPESQKPVEAKGLPKGLPAQAEIFKLSVFSALLDKMGYGQADKGHYLPEVQRAAELGKEVRDETGWENFVLAFFKNEVRFNRFTKREDSKAQENLPVGVPIVFEKNEAVVAQREAEQQARIKARFASFKTPSHAAD